MSETTPLIKAALNLRVGAGFDVYIPSSNAEKITHSIFYTAITRAKEKLKIFWSAETMKSIIENFTTDENEQRTLPIIRKELAQ